MPKIDFTVPLLQKELVKKFGKNIGTAGDCASLANELTAKTGAHISSQSLRRFFGLVKYAGGFSHFTLDILSQYCGHRDFEAFRLAAAEKELIHFFGNKAETEDGEFFWELSEALCERILHSPALLLDTHHRLMKYPLARKFFMEFHPMRDLICTVYAQYFQEYLKYNHGNEAKLFSYGFLYTGAILSENKEFRENYFRKVLETPVTPEVYVLPAGRKYGVILHYADEIGDEKLFAETWKAMLKARKEYKTRSQKSVCSFEYMVLEYLIFTDRTEEMSYLIDHNTKQTMPDRQYVPIERKEAHDQVWYILCASAYIKIGDKRQAQHFLKKTDVEKLTVGWKSYYTILHNFVLLNFAKKSDREAIIHQQKDLLEGKNFTLWEKHLTQLEQNYLG